jgi:hypothetical protein
MTEHNFNLDDAMSVNEFFKSNGVSEKTFKLTECTTEDGKRTFTALGLTNGDTYEKADGTTGPAMTFFCLSKKLSEAGEVLDRAFIKAHKDEIRLLEPVDGLKFGILFLPGERESWDDL